MDSRLAPLPWRTTRTTCVWSTTQTNGASRRLPEAPPGVPPRALPLGAAGGVPRGAGPLGAVGDIAKVLRCASGAGTPIARRRATSRLAPPPPRPGAQLGAGQGVREVRLPHEAGLGGRAATCPPGGRRRSPRRRRRLLGGGELQPRPGRGRRPVRRVQAGGPPSGQDLVGSATPCRGTRPGAATAAVVNSIRAHRPRLESTTSVPRRLHRPRGGRWDQGRGRRRAAAAFSGPPGSPPGAGVERRVEFVLRGPPGRPPLRASLPGYPPEAPQLGGSGSEATGGGVLSAGSRAA